MKTSPIYTPGPWSTSIGDVVRVIAGQRTIAGVHLRGVTRGTLDRAEIEANAHLIAAAPDLLTLLQHPAMRWLTSEGYRYLPDNRGFQIETSFLPLRRKVIRKALMGS